MIAAASHAGDRALFRTVTAWDVESVTDDPADLAEGFHAVALTFEGELRAARLGQVAFHDDASWAGASVLPASVLSAPQTFAPQAGDSWASSLDAEAYRAAVQQVRQAIAAGDVYQVNTCRMLSHEASRVDMDGLFLDVLRHNPAPYACRLDIAGHLDVVSASPELFLAVDGHRVISAPIKGTAVTAEAMLDKDVAENIMITDLVRNDLQRVCEPGSVVVDPLLEEQAHPGLVHLVSTVRGRLRADATWTQLLEATFPPGSVSGAPKSSALELISKTEPVPRGVYCGAVGWVDASSGRAELAVGIRTFERRDVGGASAESSVASSTLAFGTGAGITWDSDPQGEWDETQLKAHRLVTLAQRHLSRERR